MIPTSSLVILGFTALFCSLLPFISAFIWTRKKEKSMKPFFIGAAFYIFFVLIIESVLNELIFQNEFLFNNTLFYIVYSCLAAAFIEEGSRYIAFKYVLKDEQKEDALTYGLGHGGIEMILIIGISLLSSLMFGMIFNSAGMETMLSGSNETQQIAITEMITALQNYGIQESLICIIERTSVLIFHLSCSIFVYMAVYKKEKRYFIYALIFHFIMNLPSLLNQRGLISNIWIAEGLIVLIALSSAVLGYKYYRKNLENNE